MHVTAKTSQTSSEDVQACHLSQWVESHQTQDTTCEAFFISQQIARRRSLKVGHQHRIYLEAANTTKAA